MGSGDGSSGRAAASCPDNLSLIPVDAGLFSLSFNQWRVLNQVSSECATLTDFPNKNRLSGAA